MKIKGLLLVALFACGILANAQPIAKGDKVLNLGIGLGSTLYSGSYYKSTTPPLSASLEVCVKDELFDGKGALGVGGYLGYSGFKSEYNWGGGTYGWKYTNIIIGPRGYLHYNFLDKLDTYTGILLGYWIATNKEYGTIQTGYSSDSYGGVTWSWFAGGRYYFSDKFAGMLELGYGISYLNLGIAVKL
ncbi:MAG: hypothetical protein IPH88_01830 [Bacteroidales bacterium]|nr:hypothetical protein [Bacteroidales bacterium]